MTKRKDAGTGKYISAEQAEHQDKNTWIIENAKKFGMDDRTHLLASVYSAIKSKSYEEGGLQDRTDIIQVINMDDVNQVFKDAGFDVEKLKEAGIISGE